MINEKFNFNFASRKVGHKIEWHSSHTAEWWQRGSVVSHIKFWFHMFSACVTFYDYCNDYFKLQPTIWGFCCNEQQLFIKCQFRNSNINRVGMFCGALKLNLREFISSRGRQKKIWIEIDFIIFFFFLN